MLSWYWLILLGIARAVLPVVLAYALYKTRPLYRRLFQQQPISGLILTLLIAALIGVPARNFGLADRFRLEAPGTQIMVALIAGADWLLLFLWGYPRLSLLMALLFGLVGREFGMGYLFWNQDDGTQFLVGLSLAGLCLFLFSVNYFRDKSKVAIHRLTRWALFEHGRSSLRWPAERSSEEASSTSETSDPDSGLVERLPQRHVLGACSSVGHPRGLGRIRGQYGCELLARLEAGRGTCDFARACEPRAVALCARSGNDPGSSTSPAS